MPKTIEAKTLRGRRLAAMAARGVFLAMAFLPGAALAADTQPVWEGFVKITASTPQCSGAEGTVPGETHVSIFRPKILSTDTHTFLSVVGVRGAADFKNTTEATVPQMNGSGNYAGFQVTNRALFINYIGTYSLTVTPARSSVRRLSSRLPAQSTTSRTLQAVTSPSKGSTSSGFSRAA